MPFGRPYYDGFQIHSVHYGSSSHGMPVKHFFHDGTTSYQLYSPYNRDLKGNLFLPFQHLIYEKFSFSLRNYFWYFVGFFCRNFHLLRVTRSIFSSMEYTILTVPIHAGPRMNFVIKIRIFMVYFGFLWRTINIVTFRLGQRARVLPIEYMLLGVRRRRIQFINVNFGLPTWLFDCNSGLFCYYRYSIFLFPFS